MSQKQNKFRRFFSSELFLGIVLVTGYLIYHSIKTHRDNNWTQARIEKKFSKNLVLVKHEYAIKLVFHEPKEEPMYFVKTKDGRFEKWEKGMPANFVTGAGFITSKSGDCITSRNIAYPMPENESWELSVLRKAAGVHKEFLDIRSGGYYEIFTISIGYYPAGSSIDDPNAFIYCTDKGIYDGGIHLLGAKVPPVNAKKFTGFSGVRFKSPLKVEEKLFVLGLPVDMNKTVTAVSSKASLDSSVRNSELYNEWHELYLSLPTHFMVEGAPVFNQKGNIVGVMTIGPRGYKAYFTRFER